MGQPRHYFGCLIVLVPCKQHLRTEREEEWEYCWLKGHPLNGLHLSEDGSEKMILFNNRIRGRFRGSDQIFTLILFSVGHSLIAWRDGNKISILLIYRTRRIGVMSSCGHNPIKNQDSVIFPTDCANLWGTVISMERSVPILGRRKEED